MREKAFICDLCHARAELAALRNARRLTPELSRAAGVGLNELLGCGLEGT